VWFVVRRGVGRLSNVSNGYNLHHDCWDHAWGWVWDDAGGWVWDDARDNSCSSWGSEVDQPEQDIPVTYDDDDAAATAATPAATQCSQSAVRDRRRRRGRQCSGRL
jgi:hypothetical protein